MTKQHVFPDRLQNTIPRIPGNRTQGSWDRITKNGKVLRVSESKKISQGTPAHHRLRRVCGSCNAGWLNTMEQECFPLIEKLITGEISVLRPADQTKVARMATSMAMIGEWISDDRASTRADEREYFRAKLAPPPNWYVFIGRNGTNLTAPSFLTDGCVASEKISGEDPRVYTGFTFTMGRVLLHVLALDGDIFLDPDSYAEKLGVAVLCPPTDWVNFDLLPSLGGEDIDRLRTFAGKSLIKFQTKRTTNRRG